MTVIVGAGISGLYIADTLRTRGESPVVLEKSRGVGGRMATRRTDAGRFDHGAQFYSLKPDIMSLHQRWSARGLTNAWFENEGVPRQTSRTGMTALAKDLAADLDVRLDTKLVCLERLPTGTWRLFTEVAGAAGPQLEARRVILTCPLPQSLDLAHVSGLTVPSELRDLRYAKALIGLYEGVRADQLRLKADTWSSAGYIEHPSTLIFSLTDQSRKGLTQTPCWTVTMNPEFSDAHFDRDDNATLKLIHDHLRTLSPDFQFKQAQLKKWRYAHPLTTHTAPFVDLAAGLYLAGDAFGGPSLNGAIRSAQALVANLS